MLNETMPPNTKHHRTGPLDLPHVEPWPDPVDGARLLDDTARLLARFVVLPKWAPETLALWILHTHAFELRDVSTYLGVESPEKRCGKTTLLTVLGELVSRPVIAANISSPAFFRVIEEARPTLLIDEADTFLDGNDELRGILNSGYSRKTAYVVRVRPGTGPHDPGSGKPPGGLPQSPDSGRASLPGAPTNTHTRLEKFSCWCPKVIAAIGRLPDTLSDRCIIIRMQRKTAGETCERLREFSEDGIRARCVRFVRDHADAIRAARPDIPEALNDRAADIWEPLLVLADLAGGRWPDAARQAAASANARAQAATPISSLLLDIFIALARSSGNRIFSRDLVEFLEDMGDRPYKETLKGRPLTTLWIGQQLRPYGVASKTIWIGGTAAKGYVQEDFKEVFKRYLSRCEARELIDDWRKGQGAEQPELL